MPRIGTTDVMLGQLKLEEPLQDEEEEMCFFLETWRVQSPTADVR